MIPVRATDGQAETDQDQRVARSRVETAFVSVVPVCVSEGGPRPAVRGKRVSDGGLSLWDAPQLIKVADRMERHQVSPRCRAARRRRSG